MESQQSISNANIIVSRQRSLPIPKIVNNYILTNYGAAYYSSQNLTEKQEILKKIENECANSGYVNIRSEEIERRLKNMKSHYRRKKQELETGTSQSVVWEYFDVLDGIFTEIDKNKPVEKTVVVISPKVVVVGQKREAEQTVPQEDPQKPQDLSVKRARVIEFRNFDEISNQISLKPLPNPPGEDTPESKEVETKAETPKKEQPSDIQTMIATIKFIDQQRLEVNRQLVFLETYRCQLDTFGCHLNQELLKMLEGNRSTEK